MIARSRVATAFGACVSFCVLQARAASETALPPCPDKRFEAVVVSGGVYDGGHKLIFRRTGSRKRLGSQWLFGPKPKLLWSPDGHYAALEYYFARHFMKVDVFEVNDAGVRRAEIQDYTQNIYGQLGALHGGNWQSDTILKWLNNDQLLIQTRGKTSDDEENLGYCFRVQIHMYGSGNPLLGWLEKIEKADPSEAGL